MKTSRRTLLISDLHCPFQHPRAFSFLKELKREFRPDLIVNVGDEVDAHALSFHSKDPDNPSAGDEHKQAKAALQELHNIFPQMELVESNHGSLHYRKALDAGIPRAYIRHYNEVWGVSKWNWHNTFTFWNKTPICVIHGKAKHAVNVSKNSGMNLIQGHHHTEFSIRYWANPLESKWAMQVGCLIDDEQYSFIYNKNTVERPIIGTGVVIEGVPRLVTL